jgi:hypothetical protein
MAAQFGAVAGPAAEGESAEAVLARLDASLRPVELYAVR